jgi:hypothetical protein
MTCSMQSVSCEDLNLREESLYKTIQRYPRNLKTFDAMGHTAARGIVRLASILRVR